MIELSGLQLEIGLSSWVVQDGNFSEFQVGTEASFALEFFAAEGLRRSWLKGALLHRQGDGNYNVRGQVLHVAEDWWAIDYGVPAYAEEAPPADARVGDWIEGSINFGVDPFFYCGYRARERGAPPLIADWHIDAIAIETAPFLRNGNVRWRDPDRRGWRNVERTDAWNDDDGSAEYLLTCTMQSSTLRHAE